LVGATGIVQRVIELPVTLHVAAGRISPYLEHGGFERIGGGRAMSSEASRVRAVPVDRR
jgi:hypothetical protein